MGDQGRLYVDPSVVPAYKSLLHSADLILPNQFEAEQLSGTTISTFSSLTTAISALHRVYAVPHIVVTSVRLARDASTISVVGSSARLDTSPRIWKIDVEALPCFFSGTGDMFAALILVRFREAAIAADLLATRSWMSPDRVEAVDLPLARAAKTVLASMHTVLEQTMVASNAELEQRFGKTGVEGGTKASMGLVVEGLEGKDLEERKRYLAETKATEVRIVRNVGALKCPQERYVVEAFNV